MSRRQPTLKIGGLTIALDEIVKIVNQSLTRSLRGRQKNAAPKAIQLVDGTIVPLLSPEKVKEVIEFIDRYEQ